jgi:transcriptional regulator with XRE-family HTH domain
MLSTIIVYDRRIAMTLTPEQSRAARGLLDWSQTQLGRRSNLSESTIRDFEKGRRVPSVNNLAAIRAALETAGVEFTNGEQPGVRLKKQNPVTSEQERQMSYFLIHRFNQKEPHQVRKQPFRTEPEAVIHACAQIMANAVGDFIVEDDKGNVVTNDQEIRNRCKATRMP